MKSLEADIIACEDASDILAIIKLKFNSIDSETQRSYSPANSNQDYRSSSPFHK